MSNHATSSPTSAGIGGFICAITPAAIAAITAQIRNITRVIALPSQEIAASRSLESDHEAAPSIIVLRLEHG